MRNVTRRPVSNTVESLVYLEEVEVHLLKYSCTISWSLYFSSSVHFMVLYSLLKRDLLRFLLDYIFKKANS